MFLLKEGKTKALCILLSLQHRDTLLQVTRKQLAKGRSRSHKLYVVMWWYIAVDCTNSNEYLNAWMRKHIGELFSGGRKHG